MIYRGRIVKTDPNGYYVEVPRMGRGMELFAPLSETAYAAGDAVYVSSADDQFDNIVIVTGAPLAVTDYVTEAELVTALDAYPTNTEINNVLSNYATNVALSTKLDQSAYTAADVLTKIKTVDGVGSGLDADLLDGQSSAYYATASSLGGYATTSSLGSYATNVALGSKLDTTAYTANDVKAKLLTVDGDGSTIDSDLLDGQHGTYYKVPGVVSMFAGSTAPTGTLLCDGAAVSRTTYATLFAVIDTTYGVGDGSTTFNVPNLKGRVPAGLDAAQSEFDTRGKTGGSKTHTLTVAEMPSHNHGGNTGNESNGHTHNIGSISTSATGFAGAAPENGGGSVVQGGTTGRFTHPVSATGTATGINASDHTHPITSQGGGAAHNNLQPYIVMNYIINT